MKNFRAPGEGAARERTWEVVRTAFEQRQRVSWPRRHAVPLVATAVVAAALAAFLSPPGRSVIDSLRRAVGIQHSSAALFSLPAGGRLLVESTSGVWVVHPDGSKRRLPGYSSASWSPHGLFLAGTRRNELVALTDTGEVHWTLSRPHPHFVSWTGTKTDTRIAYACRRCPGVLPAIRAVGGDGRDDRWLTKDFFPVAPAWRPGTSHELAVAHTDGRIRIWEADTRALVGATPKIGRPLALAWTTDGSFLYALERLRLDLFDPHGRLTVTFRLHRWFHGFHATGLAVGPDRSVGLLLRRGGRSEVAVLHNGFHRVFAGSGHFTDLAWSPNGRWLLVAWKEANQWVFIRSARVQTIRAVSGIKSQFDSRTFPTIAGWCCSR
jgi:WD40 domain-containing protein